MARVPLTKGDLVAEAARKAALASGITLTQLDPQTISDGLVDLETMLRSWRGGPQRQVIDTNYNFATIGDSEIEAEDPHNLYDYAIDGVILNLAVRMLIDVSTAAGSELATRAAYAKGVIVNADRSRFRRSRYRSRTPTGSGNRGLASFGARYYTGNGDENGEDNQ